MIYLLPAALCSIAIALVLKVNERLGGNRIAIAGVNYAVASVASLAILRGNPGSPDFAAFALGTVAGAVWVAGFLVFMAGIAAGPLAITVTATRLAVVIPVAFSIVLWRENPGPMQWTGIALGLAAIAILGSTISSDSKASLARKGYRWLIIALFTVMGVGDLLLKIFRESGSDIAPLAFSFILFAVAACLTWGIIAFGRINLDPTTVGLGILLGLPNLGSTVFTLRALETVNASVAFPFINLTVIAGTTLLGFSIWREKLAASSILGLILAATSIVLLSSR